MIQLTTPSHGPTPPHNPRYHCNLVTVTDLPFKIILQWLQCSLVFPCCAVFMLALVSVSVSSDACCQVPCPGSGPSLLTMYSTAHSLRRVGVTVPLILIPTTPFSPTSVPGSELSVARHFTSPYISSQTSTPRIHSTPSSPPPVPRSRQSHLHTGRFPLPPFPHSSFSPLPFYVFC
jgi:hypothetical protein